MNLALDNPQVVLPLIALAVALGGLSLFLGWRRRERKVVTRSLLRCVAALLLTFIAAGLSRTTSDDRLRVSLLLDISESMDSAAVQELVTKAQKSVPPTAKVSLFPFAGKRGALPLAADSSLSNLRTSWASLDIGKTNLETALSELSSEERTPILLISDGQETVGSALAAGYVTGSPIFPILPDTTQNEGEQLRISQLYAPLIAPTAQSAEIRTSIKNVTASVQRGMLVVKDNATVVLEREVSLQPESEIVVTALSNPTEEGIREISATFTPRDTQFSKSSEIRYLSGKKRERLLLLSGSDSDARFLSQALSDQAYRVEAFTGAAGVPNTLDLSRYSSVILNNISYRELPAGSGSRLVSYVKEGGGLLMIGGNKSFGLGGYIDSPLAPLLPVEMVPPQTVQKRLNVAVALVIDKSRSMADEQKLDFAKDAAREVIRNLKDDDYVGVIGFDAAPFVVVEMNMLGSNRASAEERVGRLFAAGRTSLLPAMEEARRALSRAQSGRKHMIILTDGKLPDSGPFYTEMTKQMRPLGITVSTVLLGSMDDGLLSKMADSGGGAFYQTVDARNLPRIFLQDVRVNTGEQTLKEASEYTVRTTRQGAVSTSLTTFPSLKGYVETKERDKARLELVAMGDGRAQPLLASWDVNLGRAIAFTSDSNGRWSSAWINWSAYHAFWSDVVNATRGGSSKDRDEDVRFDLRTALEGNSLLLDVTVFSDPPPRSLSAAITLPNGSKSEVTFDNKVAGRFLYRIEGVLPGKYTFAGNASGKSLTPVAFHLSGELFGERKGLGFNRPLLEQIASRSGGKLNPTPQDIASGVVPRIKNYPLAPWLFLLALLLLMVEIGQREQIFSYRALISYIREKVSRPVKP